MSTWPSDLLFVALPATWFGVSAAIYGFSLLRKQAEPVAVSMPEKPPMILKCVTVAVDYSDFLCWSLPLNKQHFNQMVVVTSSKDVATQKLCEFWNVQCVVTDVFYKDGADFNKGAAINEGLKALGDDGWVVHMDADIVLPPLFRQTMEKLQLDEEGIYGIDRLMCDDFIDWLSYFVEPQTSQEADIYVHLRPFPVGVRIAKMGDGYGGWLPCGYFQAFCQRKMKLTYPDQHTDAGRTDMLFALKFPRQHRHLLPEIVGIHLETKKEENGKMGSNWSGRTTPRFGAEVLARKKGQEKTSLETKESHDEHGYCQD